MDQLEAMVDAPWPDRPSFEISLPGDAALDTAPRALVMGVVNVTPDSFSDGGEFIRPDLAVEQARRLVGAGADIVDIGGESTRPGSAPVPDDVEKRRVLPVIRELASECRVPISIDTQKSEVAEAALDAGAAMVNDVSALRTDPRLGELIAERGVPACIMHMQGTPRTMQKNPEYREVVSDIKGWLSERIEYAVSLGIGRENIVIDPGFGFGKTVGHNLELLRRLHEFHSLGCPLLIGTSRKSTIGHVLGVAVEERLYGTLGTVACAVLAGCHIVRVHDVHETMDVVKMVEAVRCGINYGTNSKYRTPQANK